MPWSRFPYNGFDDSSTATSAPSNPKDGDLWTDSNSMITYVWYNDGDSTQWVEVANNARPITLSGTFASRPAAATAGIFYLATDTSRLYLDTGSSWIEVLADATQSDAQVIGTQVFS